MDVKTYREKMLSELKGAGQASDGKPAAETLQMLDRKAESAKSRAEAIHQTDLDSENLESIVRQYLKTVSDKNEAVSVRLAALRALKIADFHGPNFDAYRADYHETLRGIVADASPKVREDAIEVLAISKDSFVKDKLLQGLKDAKGALVSVEKAIQYLGYDEHSDAISTVRGMFDKLSAAAKEEALRMLASDPESEGLLTKLIKDKSQKSALRCLSAVGLKSANPSAFHKVAQEIVTNDDDFDEIRAACLSALTSRADAVSDEIEAGFSERVEGIKTKSRNLRASMKRFLKSRR